MATVESIDGGHFVSVMWRTPLHCLSREIHSGTHAALCGAAMHSLAYELARCPVCNGADSHEIAGADDVRDEMEALWAFHTRRLREDTPPERLTDRVAFSQAPPLRLVQCT